MRRLRIKTDSRSPSQTPDASFDIAARPNQVIGAFMGELGTEAIETFTTTVQPVLMNKCASCHANLRYQGEFKLWRLSNQPLSQRFTSRNLESARSQIDRDRPEESPLLQLAVTPEAESREPAAAMIRAQGTQGGCCRWRGPACVVASGWRQGGGDRR